LQEHRRSPDDEAEENNADAMVVDEVRSPPSECQSPIAVSLASSASSVAPPPPLQIPVAKKGVGNRPAAAPLVDARNVYTTRRRGQY